MIENQKGEEKVAVGHTLKNDNNHLICLNKWQLMNAL
jgi:hypothetical protein